MKTKTITSTLIIILVFAGLFVWGYYAQKGSKASVQGVGDSNNSVSLLAASETLYDFGAISMKNGDVSKEFTITNPTGADISLKTVVTSCMCTAAFVIKPDGSAKGPFGMVGMGYATPVDEIIKAGESLVVRAVFDPNAHGPAGVGMIDRFITLTDGAGGTINLEIKALVTP